MRELQELAKDGDADIAAEAVAELAAAEARLRDAEAGLLDAVLPREAEGESGAVIEVRAGTGGEEAALFAGELFAMYRAFSGAATVSGLS